MRGTRFAIVVSLASLGLGCGSKSAPPATYRISGTISGPLVAGINVSLSGTSSATSTTDVAGQYAFTGLANGRYTVTPSLSGYVFAPASRTLDVADQDDDGEDFEDLSDSGLRPGTWTIAISGVDGCGEGTKLVQVQLGVDPSQVAPATVTQHTAGCGDSSPSNWTFQVTSFDASTRRGHAVLSCGPGCGWEYETQSDESGGAFSMIDVSPLNPGNFQAGLAIRQAAAGAGTLGAGSWTMAISGVDGCGVGTKLVGVQLGADPSKVVPVTVTDHTAGCGDSSPTDWTFQVTSFDASTGRGHAGLSCGPGCGWEYELQADESGNAFAMVDVSPLNPLNFQAGLALRQPAVSWGTSSGSWTMAISGVDGCGDGTKLVGVQLGADPSKVVPVTVTQHTAGCGDSSPTDWTFQVTAFDASTGRGHAGLSCGPGCGWEYEIQVDQSWDTFSMVDVSPLNPGNFQAGVAIKHP